MIAILIVAVIGKRSYDNYRERASAEVRSEDGSGDNAASISERAGAASNEASSAESVQAESAYADSGSQECITVSRQYVAMLRRYDAGTLPAFDVADMARLKGFRGVLFGCKGGESREEKEYLAQHPVKAEVEAASAPKSERERVFAELLSMGGVAGAGWAESSFVVKAKSTVQDPIHQLCPKLMRLAESVEMGITLEYSNESGESISTNCPTQAEQSELDAQRLVADEQRVAAERNARDQKQWEDDCAFYKAEYESRVQGVLEESKGRNSPTARLKQLEELYADSLRGCPDDNRREPALANSAPAADKGTNETIQAGFVVQVGAFPTVAAATSLRDSLQGAGFKSFTDTVSTSDGMRIRVRVGPVGSRADADALNAAIKAKIGLEGAVRPHP